MTAMPPTKKTSTTTPKTPKKKTKQATPTIKNPFATTRKTPQNTNLQVQIPTTPQTPGTSRSNKQTAIPPAEHSAKTLITPYSPTTHKLMKTATHFAHFPILTTPEILHDTVDKTPQLRKDFLFSNFNELLIFSQDFEEHVRHIQAVMAMLNKNGLKTDFVRMRIGMTSWEGVGFCLGGVWEVGEALRDGLEGYVCEDGDGKK